MAPAPTWQALANETRDEKTRRAVLCRYSAAPKHRLGRDESLVENTGTLVIRELYETSVILCTKYTLLIVAIWPPKSTSSSRLSFGLMFSRYLRYFLQIRYEDVTCIYVYGTVVHWRWTGQLSVSCGHYGCSGRLMEALSSDLKHFSLKLSYWNKAY